MLKIETNELFRAAQQGNTSYFKDLTNDDSKTEWLYSTYPRSGDTVMHYACRFCHIDLVKYLVECGADIEVANFDGKRSLHEAAQYGSLDCVEYLLKCGAQIDCLKRADW